MTDPEADREFWAAFEDAARCREAGSFEQAMSHAKQALSLAGQQRRLRGVATRELGLECMMAGDRQAALHWFTEAVACTPNSELSSLGLYHALFNSGRIREALMEALRYSEKRYGAEYEEMFHASFVDRDSDDAEFCDLADQVRANLRRRLTESQGQG